MKSYLIILLFLFALIGCKSKDDQTNFADRVEPISEKFSFQGEQYSLIGLKREVLRKVYKDVQYTIRVITALDFLNRTDQNPDPSDIPSLEQELVCFLEFSSLNPSIKDVFKLDQNVFSYQKSVEMAAFHLEKQIWIKQSGKRFMPKASQFEREFNISGKKRVLLFFKGVDINNPFELIINDELFGAGLMKFSTY